MKISITNGNNGHNTQRLSATPEDASSSLRKNINNYRFHHLHDAGWVVWKLVILTIKAFLLFAVEVFLVYMIFGLHVIFIALFLITNILLLIVLANDLRKKFWKKRLKESILIGKSFAHLVESYNNAPIKVGSTGNHYVNYIKEPNPHVLMIGSTSSGKTTTLRSFVSRVSSTNHVPFLIIDWNGENEDWAKAANVSAWKVPANFKVNLFKLNGMTKEARASVAVESLAIAAHLTALQTTKVKTSLLKFYLNGKEPSLLELWKALCSRDAGKSNLLNQRLRAIQRVIGTEPDDFWNNIFERNSLVSLMGLNESEKSLVAYTILQRLTELFDKESWKDSKPRLMVVVDEAWQLLKREREFDQLKESVAEKIVRMGRKYGVGIIISTQQIEDIPKVFINSSSLLMVHQHREASYYGKDILQLDPYEKSYMKNAAQGEMLLFDRGMSQEGHMHADYVKVEPLSNVEIESLVKSSVSYEPSSIAESELPIEEYDNSKDTVVVEKPKEAQVVHKKIIFPSDMPTPVQYAGLLAIHNNPNLELSSLIKYVKDKAWFSSPNTIYGSKHKRGIFQNLLDKGLAKESGNYYSLTEKGVMWVDADILMSNQSDKLGSEEHKQLMRKTIKMLQNELKICIVSKEKHSFDILAIPVDANKRGIWDLKNASGYEIQTSARKDSIMENMDKGKLWGVRMVWVTDNKQILDEIKKMTNNNQNEYKIVSQEFLYVV
jgi:Cdc6-like AAA superfamily ATPase